MNFCGDGLTQCNLISPFSGDGSVLKNSPAMQGMWVQSLGQEHPLEKEMATTPVFLPGTEEPDGLQSMGSQRVRHD